MPRFEIGGSSAASTGSASQRGAPRPVRFLCLSNDISSLGPMLLAEQSEAVRGEGGDQEDDQQPVGRSGELPDEPPSERRRPLGDGQYPRGTRQRHETCTSAPARWLRARASPCGPLRGTMPAPSTSPAWPPLACITHPRAPPSPDPTSHPPRGGPSFISRQQSTIQCHRHQPHHRHYISSVLGTQRPVADRRHPVCSHDGHMPVHVQVLPCRPAQPPRSTGRKPFDAGPAGITINGPSRP